MSKNEGFDFGEFFGKIFAFMVGSALVLILFGFVLTGVALVVAGMAWLTMTAWNLVLTPVAHLPIINIWQAWGVNFIIGLLGTIFRTVTVSNNDKK